MYLSRPGGGVTHGWGEVMVEGREGVAGVFSGWVDGWGIWWMLGCRVSRGWLSGWWKWVIAVLGRRWWGDCWVGDCG